MKLADYRMKMEEVYTAGVNTTDTERLDEVEFALGAIGREVRRCLWQPSAKTESHELLERAEYCRTRISEKLNRIRSWEQSNRTKHPAIASVAGLTHQPETEQW